MVARIGWAVPPPCPAPPGYAAGEESLEVRTQYARASLTPPIHYGPGRVFPHSWPTFAMFCDGRCHHSGM